MGHNALLNFSPPSRLIISLLSGRLTLPPAAGEILSSPHKNPLVLRSQGGEATEGATSSKTPKDLFMMCWYGTGPYRYGSVLYRTVRYGTVPVHDLIISQISFALTGLAARAVDCAPFSFAQTELLRILLFFRITTHTF